jgi:alkylation response protein AidB-like acyl-CoA dehydrogenase
LNLSFNSDQQALLDAVERIALDHEAQPSYGTSHWEHSASLQADLDGAGVFDAAAIEELGPVAATAMVLRLARLPQCMELVAAALILPLLAPTLPRPCALLQGDHNRPARWLPGARSVVCVRDGTAFAALLQDKDVASLDSPFGYPVGRLVLPAALDWQALDVDTQALRRLWQLGVAAELAGCLDAGLRAVVAHVTERRQFGRPLGAFQAIQHRLAHAAVQVEAARWMALQAAFSGSEADAAAALAYVQQAVPAITYDLHQFMGAMGLTLEHPLHRWTTRAKMLRADLGGAQMQLRALADLAWGPARTSTQDNTAKMS